MKIALLSFEYPPETGFGGIGTYTWHHARALADRGHEVHVLAGASKTTALRSEDSAGVHVHRFWAGGRWMDLLGLPGRLRLWWTRQRLQNAWSMYLGICELHRVHRFDLLEMPECGAEGALITRLLALPTVVRLHSPAALIMPYYDVRRLDVWFCSAIEKRAMNAATALTACSRFVSEETARRLGINRPCRVIANGLDLAWVDAAFAATDIHQKFGLRKRALTIVFTGRMERRKGIHLCTAIAAAILQRHDVCFVFAGSDLFGYVADTLLPALAPLALKGSAHHLGQLGLSDLRQLVRAADIVLLPSLWENCPYACLEAMALGRAVVAASQGGMPELITDGVDGMLATVDDAPAFIRSLERLIEDPEMRTRLGSAARATIERAHTAAHLAEVAEAFYAEVIATRTATNP